MAQTSRIRFNPVTREVEIEGTESFVKSYFAKIQTLLSGLEEAVKEPAARRSRVLKKAAKEPAARKSLRRGGISSTIIEIVRASEEGIGIPALTKETGFTQQQVRTVIFKAEKQGVIQRVKRGVYVTA